MPGSCLVIRRRGRRACDEARGSSSGAAAAASARARAVVAADAGVVGSGVVRDEQLRLYAHDADLTRSFAKVGPMSLYVVITVDGQRILRSGAGVLGTSHRSPSWDAVCPLAGGGSAISTIEVAVRSANRLGRDVACGCVELPGVDVAEFVNKEFPLMKNGKRTGVIRLSLSNAPVSELFSARHTSLPQNISSRSFKRQGSSILFDSTCNPEVVSINDDQGDSASDGGVAEADAKAEETSANAETEAGESASDGTLRLSETDDDAAGLDMAALNALAGSWTCVATTGLEDFLKQAGVGMIHRRIALAARWPSWDFALDGERLLFINHSQLGDLREEVILDGSAYSHKDLQGHPLTCSASWQPTADGVVLTICRDCELGPFVETRTVCGDTLSFTLTKSDGLAWGRTFKRAA